MNDEEKLSRADQAAARREQLLDVALELFAERGYGWTSMRDLAEEAGVSPGLVYHYFPGKEDLLRAVVHERSLVPEIRAVMSTADARPVDEVMLDIVTRFRALLQRRDLLLRLLVTESQTNEMVREVWRDAVATGSALVADYLQKRVDSGELRPHQPLVAGRMLIPPVVFAHLLGVENSDWLPELVDLLLNGLRANPAGEEKPTP